MQSNLNAVIAQERDAATEADKDSDRTREAARQTVGVLSGQLDAAQADRTALLARQAKEQASMAAYCRTTPERCALGALQGRQRQEMATADRRVADARQALQRRDDAEQRQQDARHVQLTADKRDLHARRATLEASLDGINREIASAGAALAAARQAADKVEANAAVERQQSQMHRMARFFIGADDNDAAMRMVGWFSIVVATVLATAGSVLAAMHYRTMTQPAQAGPNKLARALHGWVARQRRRHSIVKTVEVEKRVEVPVEVEKIVERRIEVPVNVDRIVEKLVEVTRPELVRVAVPLEATESERRRLMAEAAQEYPSRTLQDA